MSTAGIGGSGTLSLDGETGPTERRTGRLCLSAGKEKNLIINVSQCARGATFTITA